MEKYFKNSKVLHGDCFVADYTNESNSKRGVVMSDVPFEDIEFFHLKKISNSNITYLAVNFEEYPLST